MDENESGCKQSDGYTVKMENVRILTGKENIWSK